MVKQIRYTPEFKMQTVQMYLQGNLSANQLALDLGVHPHTVRHWIQDYNDGKMTATRPSCIEDTGISMHVNYGKAEQPKRADIGIILSKIGELESEVDELKNILQAYLLR